MTKNNDRSHQDSHNHSQAPSSFNGIFAFTTALNLVFVGVEFSFGFITNSAALMADAGHNLSDVLGLFLAWGAGFLALRPANNRYTFGFRSSSILAALLNSVLLLVACGGIAWESITRFSETPEVPGLTVSLVAGIGILVNGLSALLLSRGSKDDINIRGGYLHMIADTAVSVGVVVAGLIMNYTAVYWVDPALSLIIVLVIVFGTWDLLLESVKLAISAVPSNINIEAVDNYLRNLPGVIQTRDLHIWGMSTTETALTVHLVMPAGYPGDPFLNDVTSYLSHEFDIAHVTIQVQQGAIKSVCDSIAVG